MVRIQNTNNILMELRKICQHPYLSSPDMEDMSLSEADQEKALIDASGKLKFLKQLLPRLKEKGYRILLFSQFKVALDRIEDFLYGEGYKFRRLDGDVAQVNRQKDMDSFNAPDSEDFIFLLTTRAGGVGINLATADAVILFDPDFNPHQDLQAISRSHRFGQKKRVLVFRLMMENSVEARIINQGKRKMVLDHLIVQQMGKETDENQVDSLILYGAEEIAKSNPDDTSADRVWTPELIDELIDGAEKEAEEQAKELEAHYAAEDAAAAADEEAGVQRHDNGFSFARIWETKAPLRGDTTPLDDEPEPFANDDTWQAFLEQAEKEKQKDEVTSGPRMRAAKMRKGITYVLDDEQASSPKSGRKGKGKKKGDDTEDFTGVDDESESEDEFFDAVPENTDLELTAAKHTGMTDAPSKMSGKERKALKKQALIAAGQTAAKAADVAVQNRLDAAAAPGPANQIKSTKQPSKDQALRHDADMSMLSNSGPVFVPTNPGILVPAAPAPTLAARPARPHGQPHPGGAIHAAKVASAREVLVRLKGLLGTIKDPAKMQIWYAVTDLDREQDLRRMYYAEIAGFADAYIAKRQQAPYYTSPGSFDVVYYYVGLGHSVKALAQQPPPGKLSAPLPIPQNPLYAAIHQNGQQQHVQNGHPASLGRPPGPSIVQHAPHQQMGPTAYHRMQELAHRQAELEHNQIQHQAQRQHQAMQIQQARLHAQAQHVVQHQQKVQQQRQALMQKMQEQDATLPQQPAPPLRQPDNSSHSPTSSKSVAQSPATIALAIPAPITTIALSSNSSAEAGARPTTPHSMQLGDSSRFGAPTPAAAAEVDEETTCYWCQGNHNLRDCPNLVPLDKLDAFEKEIQDGTEDPEDKNSALEAVRRMRIAHTELAARKKKSRPRTSGGATADDSILIPDDDDIERPPAKRQRVSGNDSGLSGNATGCPICDSAVPHIVAKCPVVTAGAESIAKAMKRFNKDDTLWGILSMMHQARLTGLAPNKLPKCAFCGGVCGQTVRECAETRGSRKQLKQKIRELEIPLRENEELLKDLRARKVELIADGVTSDEHKEELQMVMDKSNTVEQYLDKTARPALAPLYEAYLSWPNPDRPAPAKDANAATA